nr:tripartite tricarboxylate transporter substrate-binding protein [Polynucleobacter necessarius]
MRLKGAIISTALALGAVGVSPAFAAWEPNKPVEFIIPAGPCGGADQMARMIQGIITNNNLMKQAIIPVSKAAGADAEGFLAMKETKGDPNKIVITLSNLFTTPLATGIPLSWQDITPVAMLALDQFVLWDNAEKPYKTAKEYIDAAKAAGPGKFKMGGTGSKSEDQIITVAIEKATGATFTYLPFKGGGDIAVQLVGNHIDSTVNNPIEAVAQWRAGKWRALCVFDDTRMPYKEKVTPTQSWYDVPTCKEAGVPTDYTMLRGIFMASGVTQEQIDFYVNLFKKVRETPEWKKFMIDGAFNQTFMTGKEFRNLLALNEALQKQLMTEAGFLAK